jgi:hypothetical protein
MVNLKLFISNSSFGIIFSLGSDLDNVEIVSLNLTVRWLSLSGWSSVDCIDCAADTAVVAAVVEGVNAAKDVLKIGAFQRPWIMISVNDDVDPHFRKAGL